METASERQSSSLQTGIGSPARPAIAAVDVVAILVRLGLGIVFVYMGVQKVLHPVEFLKLVKQYDLVTAPPWLNLIAAMLPWFEIICGLLLIAGVAVRGVSLNLLLMLIPFTIIIFRRALDISKTANLAFTSVKFDCGCGSGEVVIWQKLLQNIALILHAIWLLTRKQARFSLRYRLVK
jgi:uncharacterized membrane protein YphA (DoxX/SURF4 family)